MDYHFYVDLSVVCCCSLLECGADGRNWIERQRGDGCCSQGLVQRDDEIGKKKWEGQEENKGSVAAPNAVSCDCCSQTALSQLEARTGVVIFRTNTTLLIPFAFLTPFSFPASFFFLHPTLTHRPASKDITTEASKIHNGRHVRTLTLIQPRHS